MEWIVILGIGAATALCTYLGLRSWMRRKRLASADAAPDAISVKETCDIRGKTGAVIRYDCGHEDAEEFRIDLWGEPTFHKKPEKGKLLCSDCFLKEVLASTLRCADCGFAILPRHPVAIRRVDKHMGKKAWRTMIGDGAVVCIRLCDNAPGFCGHWMGNGIRSAFPDGGNMLSQVFNSGKAMVVNIGPLEPDEPPPK